MNDEAPPRHYELLVAAGIVVVASLVLARNEDPRYLAGVLLAPVLLVARTVIVRRAAAAHALRVLTESWGKRVDRVRDDVALRRLYVACNGPSLSAAALDDATWDDLDLDAVFATLDRTLSAPGEYALYETLRTPRLDPGLLTDRERRIAALEAATDARHALRTILLRLGRHPIDPLSGLLFGNPFGTDANRPVLALQALLPIVGIVVWVVFAEPMGALLSGGAVIANAITHFRIKNEIAAAAEGIRYLSKLVRIGGELGAVKASESGPGLAHLLAETRTVADAAKAIGSRGSRIGMSELGGAGDLFQSVYEYVSIFFLLEVRNYYAVLEQLQQSRGELRHLFRLVGEVDALQSVASWRAGLPVFCLPQFVSGATELRVGDAVHPLLEEPVPNSIDLSERSMVVTGSNMAGKSTLLRTIGLASILAQTLHTVPATEYVACPLRVASSVTIRDDLAAGTSFYLAEAQRLLRLLRFAEEEGPALVLVDEPLRGTNSTERIAAVSEILLHLGEIGALTVVATHELQIAEIVAAAYDACHLGDEVDEEGLRFPHRILPGVATSRNAIRLLAKLGYPEALVESADARAAEIDAE